MIDFKTIEKALEVWISQTIDARVVWAGQRQKNTPRPYCQLGISSTVGIGVDENIVTYDATQPTGKELISTATGNRQFTLSIKVVSRDGRPSQSAKNLIEKVRTSLHKKSTLALFSDAKMSVARMLSSVDTQQQYQKRMENVSILDVRLNTIALEVDARDEGGYIDKTLVSSEVDGWPASIEMDDKEIPTP